MFEKETTRLRHLVAFFTAYTVFFYNKIDVADDVFAGDGTGQYIHVMRKEKPHLLCVIADRAGGIVFGGKHIEKMLQGLLCLW